MLPILIDDPRYYDDKVLTPEEILGWFDICDAGWIHDGDSKKPHAELSGGKCSNAFFDCLRVFSYPSLCEILARQIVRKLENKLRIYYPKVDWVATFFYTGPKVDWVVSSSYAAITFGHEVAKALGAKFGFTEKDPTDPKKQVWQRFTIPKDSNILQAEELITTSGTFQEVRRAVREGNSEPVNFLPVVGTLIHRPPKLPVDYDGTTVVSLIERQIWAVEQKDCSLCAAGSPRYRPKTHWIELTGKA